MCEFCAKHKRKKWFLDEDNYKEELLKNKGRKSILKKIAGPTLDHYMRDSLDLFELARNPLLKPVVRGMMNKFAASNHSGQAVTLEDAIAIVKLADNHVLFQCNCRKLCGLKEKMCCLNFGPMRDLVKQTNPTEKMEEINTSEAVDLLKDWNKEGLVHEVLYAAAPFPIAMCNCDRKYCMPMKSRLSTGIESSFLKGHEIAYVDPLKCKCEKFYCMTRCQFGAIYADRFDIKAVIDVTKCFGCGLCKEVCPCNAIKMEDRETVMGSRHKW
ncbi:MAG TPA: 4Fe-4S binding protein [archaeon]|nr:4Fe-4S binding protein [archaeon]